MEPRDKSEPTEDEKSEPTEDQLKRTEPDFIPGDSQPPAAGARPVVLGGDQGTPESSSPEGEVSKGSEASRRP